MAGSRIGEDVTIFPNAVLYENTVVGSRCLIHGGVVLGAYGFGCELVEGRHRLSAQLGNVELGDNIEIGAGATIDRGTYGPTLIGKGTKIDDLVMVATIATSAATTCSARKWASPAAPPPAITW